jgi:hypothetical protein
MWSGWPLNDGSPTRVSAAAFACCRLCTSSALAAACPWAQCLRRQSTSLERCPALTMSGGSYRVAARWAGGVGLGIQALSSGVARTASASSASGRLLPQREAQDVKGPGRLDGGPGPSLVRARCYVGLGGPGLTPRRFSPSPSEGAILSRHKAPGASHRPIGSPLTPAGRSSLTADCTRRTMQSFSFS